MQLDTYEMVGPRREGVCQPEVSRFAYPDEYGVEYLLYRPVTSMPSTPHHKAPLGGTGPVAPDHLRHEATECLPNAPGAASRH